MAYAVCFSNVAPIDFAPLTAAPSVRDEFNPPPEPTTLDLTAGRIRVHCGYRGTLFYLENGALLSRCAPKTGGGNGMVMWLGDEPEDCYVSFRGRWHRATVKSVSCEP